MKILDCPGKDLVGVPGLEFAPANLSNQAFSRGLIGFLERAGERHRLPRSRAGDARIHSVEQILISSP